MVVCGSEILNGRYLRDETRLTWSSISNSLQTTTLAPTCSINRYYDSATDSFISGDPYLQRTDQAYVFTNDNPLDATDPLGLAGWYCIDGVSHYYKGDKFGAKGSGKCPVATSTTGSFFNNVNIPESGTAAKALHDVVKVTTSPLDSISPSDATRIVEGLGVAAGDYASAVTAIAAPVTYYNDTMAGETPTYAAGDTVFTLGGAAAGALICGGPEDGVGIVCGIVGGFLGGGFGHSLWRAFGL
jgi:hypothetical protein